MQNPVMERLNGFQVSSGVKMSVSRLSRKEPGGVFNYVNFHVYHYAGNNPVTLVDPDGRELDITFEITSYEKTNEGVRAYGLLTVTDRNTGVNITVNAYSGSIGQAEDGVSLPVPVGNYEVLDPARVGYRLETMDYNQGNDIVDLTNPKQENLRLHGPGRGLSYGCIGVATTGEWNSVQQMFQTTSVGSSQVQYRADLRRIDTGKYGNLSVVQNEQVKNNDVYPKHLFVKTSQPDLQELRSCRARRP
jgi:hypothetical protein